ncbi:MAG: hypothetical protein FWB96_09385 [Defluviitaleaceae bacterium]|nr:hypothetical protein [Defluviitaleaceae bacterium]MCL2263445.1 hypothetical protein [Defluviitaleaceae bacterium]
MIALTLVLAVAMSLFSMSVSADPDDEPAFTLSVVGSVDDGQVIIYVNIDHGTTEGTVMADFSFTYPTDLLSFVSSAPGTPGVFVWDGAFGAPSSAAGTIRVVIEDPTGDGAAAPALWRAVFDTVGTPDGRIEGFGLTINDFLNEEWEDLSDLGGAAAVAIDLEGAWAEFLADPADEIEIAFSAGTTVRGMSEVVVTLDAGDDYSFEGGYLLLTAGTSMVVLEVGAFVGSYTIDSGFFVGANAQIGALLVVDTAGPFDPTSDNVFGVATGQTLGA